jgi:hypothetical protein
MGPIQPSTQWDRGLFSQGSSGRSVKLTTHLHLVPRLRIHGHKPPLPTRLHGVQKEKFSLENTLISDALVFLLCFLLGLLSLVTVIPILCTFHIF